MTHLRSGERPFPMCCALGRLVHAFLEFSFLRHHSCRDARQSSECDDSEHTPSHYCDGFGEGVEPATREALI